MFLAKYPQVEGLQISASEIPYAPLDGNVAFAPAGPDVATARLEIDRTGIVEAVSGVRGFKLLRLGGSAFRASCATSTRRCRTCTTVRCTCGSIWSGATPTLTPRSAAAR